MTGASDGRISAVESRISAMVVRAREDNPARDRDGKEQDVAVQRVMAARFKAYAQLSRREGTEQSEDISYQENAPQQEAARVPR